MENETITDNGYASLEWPRTKVDRAIFKKLDLVTLYGIGHVERSQVRLGITADLGRVVSLMQTDAWRPLRLHHHVWLRGDDLARRLKGDIGSRLSASGRHLRGDWYDLPSELFQRLVHVTASATGTPVLTHEAMLALIDTIREKRIQRAVSAAT